MWVSVHLYNFFGLGYRRDKKLQRFTRNPKAILQEDFFGLGEHVAAWNDNLPIPSLMIKHEALGAPEVASALEDLFCLDPKVWSLPQRSVSRGADGRLWHNSQRSRGERLAQLSSAEQRQLFIAYAEAAR